MLLCDACDDTDHGEACDCDGCCCVASNDDSGDVVDGDAGDGGACDRDGCYCVAFNDDSGDVVDDDVYDDG